MTTQCPICGQTLEDGVRACPTCGFHVLDSTQSFEPVKVVGAEMADEPAASPAQHFVLKVVRGPQTGIEIALQEGALSLGRDPRCDIFLNDMTVSRMHAYIEVKGDGCILRDNNSFNGVWVNDRPVDTCLLKSGDLIQIGAYCLLYRERV